MHLRRAVPWDTLTKTWVHALRVIHSYVHESCGVNIICRLGREKKGKKKDLHSFRLTPWEALVWRTTGACL